MIFSSKKHICVCGYCAVCVYLPAESMQTHYSSIVGTERSNRIGENLLQRQKDLMVQPTHKITMCPTNQHEKEKKNNQSD